MPWLPDGTFERVNPDYSATAAGVLWGQDLAAVPSIKIIASRHDYHDQDLGDGIAQCLNITGYNSMLANLNMGSFKITELGDATLLTDAPTFGQVAGEMLFDDGLRVLTLNDRAGNEIDTVTIPSGGGGGGEGTVTEVGVDDTLSASVNPIVNIGTIGLKFLTAGQTYSGGISNITLDDYGRVTQVTTGAFANTNLSNTPSPTNVVVESSTGNNTTLPAATNSLAGVMTATQADQLAQLWAAGGGGGMQPPIELHGISGEATLGLLDNVGIFTENSTTFVAGSYINLLNLTGSGVVNFLGSALGAQFDNSTNINFRIIIDGNEVWSGSDVLAPATAEGLASMFIGTLNFEGGGASPTPAGGLDAVAFNSSFQLQAQSNIHTPDNEVITYYKYQKFS